jgi:hypothetical protein
VKHIFRIFTGNLPEYFLLKSAYKQNERIILKNCKVKKRKCKIIINRKFKFFSIYTGFTFIIIIFHFWLPPLVNYLFSCHSMKINTVSIEKLSFLCIRKCCVIGWNINCFLSGLQVYWYPIVTILVMLYSLIIVSSGRLNTKIYIMN